MFAMTDSEEASGRIHFESSSKDGVKVRRSTCTYRNVAKVFSLNAAFICLGLATAYVGPCLLDLQHQTGSSVGEISRVFAGRACGTLLGSLLGVVSPNGASWYGITAFGLGALAIGIVIVPSCRNLPMLVGVFVIQGAAIGLVGNRCGTISHQMWARTSSKHLFVTQMSFGIGALSATVLVDSFLGDIFADMRATSNTHMSVLTTSSHRVYRRAVGQSVTETPKPNQTTQIHMAPVTKVSNLVSINASEIFELFGHTATRVDTNVSYIFADTSNSTAVSDVNKTTVILSTVAVTTRRPSKPRVADGSKLSSDKTVADGSKFRSDIRNNLGDLQVDNSHAKADQASEVHAAGNFSAAPLSAHPVNMTSDNISLGNSSLSNVKANSNSNASIVTGHVTWTVVANLSTSFRHGNATTTTIIGKGAETTTAVPNKLSSSSDASKSGTSTSLQPVTSASSGTTLKTTVATTTLAAGLLLPSSVHSNTSLSSTLASSSISSAATSTPLHTFSTVSSTAAPHNLNSTVVPSVSLTAQHASDSTVLYASKSSATHASSTTPVHSSSPTVPHTSSSTALHTSHLSSTHPTSTTPVHSSSPTVPHTSSSTALHTSHLSSTHPTSTTPVHSSSTTAQRTSSSTALHTSHLSSTHPTSTTTVHSSSTTVPRTSSSTVPLTSSTTTLHTSRATSHLRTSPPTPSLLPLSSPTVSGKSTSYFSSSPSVNVLTQGTDGIHSASFSSSFAHISSNTTQNDQQSHISVVYWIISIFTGLAAIMFVVMWVTVPKCCVAKRSEPVDRHTSRTSVSICVTTIILHFFLTGAEMTYHGLISSFAKKYLEWKPTMAVLVVAVFWLSFTIGRMLCVCVAGKLRPWPLMFGGFAAGFGALMVMGLGALHSDIFLLWLHPQVTAIWIGSALFGLSTSVILPAAERFYMYGQGITIAMILGSSGGEMAVPVLAGILSDMYSAEWIIYTVFAAFTGAATVCTVLRCIAPVQSVGSRHVRSLNSLVGDDMESAVTDSNAEEEAELLGDAGMAKEDCDSELPIPLTNTSLQSLLRNGASKSD